MVEWSTNWWGKVKARRDLQPALKHGELVQQDSTNSLNACSQSIGQINLVEWLLIDWWGKLAAQKAICN